MAANTGAKMATRTMSTMTHEEMMAARSCRRRAQASCQVLRPSILAGHFIAERDRSVYLRVRCCRSPVHSGSWRPPFRQLAQVRDGIRARHLRLDDRAPRLRWSGGPAQFLAESTGKWQAVACSGCRPASERASGSSSTQRGWALGQRGWKRHPLRRVDRRRDVAHQDDPLPRSAISRVGHGHRREQGVGVGVAGPAGTAPPTAPAPPPCPGTSAPPGRSRGGRPRDRGR